MYYLKKILYLAVISLLLTLTFSFLFVGYDGPFRKAFIYYFISWFIISAIIESFTKGFDKFLKNR